MLAPPVNGTFGLNCVPDTTPRQTIVAKYRDASLRRRSGCDVAENWKLTSGDYYASDHHCSACINSALCRLGTERFRRGYASALQAACAAAGAGLHLDRLLLRRPRRLRARQEELHAWPLPY